MKKRFVPNLSLFIWHILLRYLLLEYIINGGFLIESDNHFLKKPWGIIPEYNFFYKGKIYYGNMGKTFASMVIRLNILRIRSKNKIRKWFIENWIHIKSKIPIFYKNIYHLYTILFEKIYKIYNGMVT